MRTELEIIALALLCLVHKVRVLLREVVLWHEEDGFYFFGK